MKWNRRLTIISSSSLIVIIVTLTLVFVLVDFQDPKPTGQEPIYIWDDSDFETYDFLGTGTESDPYLIQNYEIYSNVSSCISISGTTKFVIIQNCKLLLDSSEDDVQPAISISGISQSSISILSNKINMNVTYSRNKFSFVATPSGIKANDGGISAKLIIDNNTITVSGVHCSHSIEINGYSDTIIKNNTIIEPNPRMHQMMSWRQLVKPRGIGLYSCPNSIVSYNTFGSLFIDYSSNCLIENNYLRNSAEFDIKNSENSIIRDNSFNCTWGLYYGMWFYFSENADYGYSGLNIGDDSFSCEIINNEFTNCGISLSSLESISTETYPYELLGNTVNGKMVGWFVNEQDLKITDDEYGQLFFFGCSDIYVSNQTISSVPSGIIVYDCSNSTFYSNAISESCLGILVRNSNSTLINHNIGHNNGVDFYIVNSTNTICSNNTVNGYFKTSSQIWGSAIGTSYPSYGVVFARSNETMISNNTIEEKDNALVVGDSSSVIIDSNYCYNNSNTALVIEYSSSVIIDSNYCYNSTNGGLIIDQSQYLNVTDNTFVESDLIIEMGDSIVEDRGSEDYLTYNFSNNLIDGKEFGFFTSVENLIIDSPDYATLYLVNVNDSLISNQIISNQRIGLFLFQCTNVTLSNITSTDCEIGIYASTIQRCYISDSMITLTDENYGRGVLGHLLEYCIFDRNNITENKIFDSDHLTLTENTINSVLFDNSSNVLIDNNTFDSRLGLGFRNSFNSVKITNNVFDNTEGGIDFDADNMAIQNNLTISNNSFTNNVYGIAIGTGSDVDISNNTFFNNEIGVFLNNYEDLGFSNLTISANNFTSNTDTAIRLFNAQDVTITSNLMTDNWDAINIDSQSSNCLITYNLIMNSESIGIYSNGSFITVHHNAFIDNSINAEDNGTSNIWYDEILLEGNFWSDWVSGTYTIDGSTGSEDLYPLSTNPL